MRRILNFIVSAVALPVQALVKIPDACKYTFK